MARTAKPWFRAERDSWFAWVQGKQVPLVKGRDNRKEAEKLLRKLLVEVDERKAGQGTYPVKWVSCQLLASIEREKSPATLAWYIRHLGSFGELHGATPIDKLAPGHVEEWLSLHPAWSTATRRGAITAVKRLTRWARKQGLVEIDRLADVEKPGEVVREEEMTPDDFRRILAEVKDEAFRNLLNAMWQSGCRIGEVASVTAKDVNLAAGTWTVVNKTRHKGTPKRTIYLTDALVAMCRRQVRAYPVGPIFRNMRGRPWTRNAAACRFARLREKLGMGREATSHAIRKLFCTDALEREVPIATVAELLGHKDTKMVSQVYSRLANRKQYLRDAVAKVRGPKKDTA